MLGFFRDQMMIAGRTEEELFEALSLPRIAPELRVDRGQIEAAAASNLPKLITRRDLRGDPTVTPPTPTVAPRSRRW